MLNPIVEFDRTFSLWVHACAQPWLDRVMIQLAANRDRIVKRRDLTEPGPEHEQRVCLSQARLYGRRGPVARHAEVEAMVVREQEGWQWFEPVAMVE